jgi:hypothetical protein
MRCIAEGASLSTERALAHGVWVIVVIRSFLARRACRPEDAGHRKQPLFPWVKLITSPAFRDSRGAGPPVSPGFSEVAHRKDAMHAGGRRA